MSSLSNVVGRTIDVTAELNKHSASATAGAHIFTNLCRSGTVRGSATPVSRRHGVVWLAARAVVGVPGVDVSSLYRADHSLPAAAARLASPFVHPVLLAAGQLPGGGLLRTVGVCQKKTASQRHHGDGIDVADRRPGRYPQQKAHLRLVAVTSGELRVLGDGRCFGPPAASASRRPLPSADPNQQLQRGRAPPGKYVHAQLRPGELRRGSPPSRSARQWDLGSAQVGQRGGSARPQFKAVNLHKMREVAKPRHQSLRPSCGLPQSLRTPASRVPQGAEGSAGRRTPGAHGPNLLSSGIATSPIPPPTRTRPIATGVEKNATTRPERKSVVARAAATYIHASLTALTPT